MNATSGRLKMIDGTKQDVTEEAARDLQATTSRWVVTVMAVVFTLAAATGIWFNASMSVATVSAAANVPTARYRKCATFLRSMKIRQPESSRSPLLFSRAYANERPAKPSGKQGPASD